MTGTARSTKKRSRPKLARADPPASDDHDGQAEDLVTLVKIAPREGGGIRETALAGERSLTPPSPDVAPRRGDHRASRATHLLLALAVALVVALLLVAILRST